MSFHNVSSCRVGVPVGAHIWEKILQVGAEWRPWCTPSPSSLCPILTPQVASAQMLVLPRAFWTA